MRSDEYALKVALTSLIMLVGLALFEVAKQMLAPDISIWTSHLITIFFGSVCAGAVAYLFFHKQYSLDHDLKKETAERKGAEAALLISEARFRSMYSQSPIAMELYDAKGLLMDVNPACLELFGIRDAHLIKGFKLFEDPNLPGEARQRVLAGEPVKYEFKFDFDLVRQHKLYKTTRSGFIYVECFITPWNPGGGFEKGFLVHVKDITERRQAEEALRESENWLRTVVENTPVVLFALDRRGVFTFSEGKGLTALGLNPGEVVGRSVFEVYRDAPAVLEGVRRALSGEAFSTIAEVGELAFEVWYHPFRDEQNELGGTIGVATDITARRKLEAQLLQAQKMEAVGQLAGGIAHDFNNILTAIIGFGSMMQMKMKMGADDPLKEYLDNILTSAKRAAHLTQNLLAFSRKQVMQVKPVGLNEIIREVTQFLARIIGEDIALVINLESEELTVRADRGQLEQVLMNLAANARDAMPAGGTLLLRTCRAVINSEFRRLYGYGKPGAYALLSLSDTGEGIDEAIRARVFEPFFTTKEVNKGTGLGLSIVFGIIKQHEGYITVNSTPGKGTTFMIYLPLVPPENEAAQAETHTASEGGTETILLAEDDKTIRELISRVLMSNGYTVIAAQDGEDAIQKFTENADAIHLLILDVIMPKKSGKEAYDMIKQKNPRLQALFLSGYSANIIQKKGVPDEDLHFMYKPVTPNSLLQKVREILDERTKCVNGSG